MKKAKIFLCCSLFLFTFLVCSAQKETLPLPKSLQKENLLKKKRPTFTVGGGLGFQFGTFNDIAAMPFCGIYATPWLVTLITGQYEFMWSRDLFNAHIWSSGAAVEAIIIKKIVLHTGYEFKQNIINFLDSNALIIENFHFIVAGGGYKSYINQNVYVQALILFNIPLNKPSINNYNFNFFPYFKVVFGLDL